MGSACVKVCKSAIHKWFATFFANLATNQWIILQIYDCKFSAWSSQFLANLQNFLQIFFCNAAIDRWHFWEEYQSRVEYFFSPKKNGKTSNNCEIYTFILHFCLHRSSLSYSTHLGRRRDARTKPQRTKATNESKPKTTRKREKAKSRKRMN